MCLVRTVLIERLFVLNFLLFFFFFISRSFQASFRNVVPNIGMPSVPDILPSVKFQIFLKYFLFSPVFLGKKRKSGKKNVVL